MHRILLLGTGKSSSYVVKYLLEKSRTEDWILEIGDQDPSPAKAWIKETPKVRVFTIDVEDQAQRRAALERSRLVISLLPAHLHVAVAKDALMLGVHMLTASYVQEDLQALSKSFADRHLILLMEMGVDPGIDHMIAMKMIDQIRKAGHQIRSFYSCTGALLAPQSVDQNPWRYKFTWSPYQIMRAGKPGAQFIEQGRVQRVPYHQLFHRIRHIHIPHHGDFEVYANRDSISYRETYKLDDIDTLYRGTLRPLGFSEVWHILVQTGLTDDGLRVDRLESMTHRAFVSSFLSEDNTASTEVLWARCLGVSMNDDLMHKLRWIGLFDDTPIGMSGSATALEVLQHIFEKKWMLSNTDRDQVVLWEQIQYTDAQQDQLQTRTAQVICLGKDGVHTAVAKTVGLTLGIGARLILEGKLSHLSGLHLPILPEIYDPTLAELATYDIQYTEEQNN